MIWCGVSCIMLWGLLYIIACGSIIVCSHLYYGLCSALLGCVVSFVRVYGQLYCEWLYYGVWLVTLWCVVSCVGCFMVNGWLFCGVWSIVMWCVVNCDMVCSFNKEIWMLINYAITEQQCIVDPSFSMAWIITAHYCFDLHCSVESSLSDLTVWSLANTLPAVTCFLTQ